MTAVHDSFEAALEKHADVVKAQEPRLVEKLLVRATSGKPLSALGKMILLRESLLIYTPGF